MAVIIGSAVVVTPPPPNALPPATARTTPRVTTLTPRSEGLYGAEHVHMDAGRHLAPVPSLAREGSAVTVFAGRWTLDDLEAVGEVRLTGVTLGPSACDPPGTWRASRCELLRLYVTDDTHAEALSWSLRVPVTAGLPTSS